MQFKPQLSLYNYQCTVYSHQIMNDQALTPTKITNGQHAEL